MGYQPVKKIYNLHFEGLEYEGLEVKALSVSLGQLQRAASIKIDANKPEQNMEMFAFFSKRLVSWNVDHPEIEDPDKEGKCPMCTLKQGERIPTTPLGMMCLEIDFILKIIGAWMAAIASVDGPKELNMNVGDRLAKALQTLQTETLPTPNLETSHTPN